MHKRRAVSVNWAAEMYTDEDGHDCIHLRELGGREVLSMFIRVNPPHGSWAKIIHHGGETVPVDQDTNLLLSILWFNGK